MNDKDQKQLESLYESIGTEEKDHVIYVDLGDDVWEIDLKSEDHSNDCYKLLDKIKDFLIHYKNDGDTNHHFLDGLLNSKKLEKYLKKFDTHPEEFLNKL